MGAAMDHGGRGPAFGGSDAQGAWDWKSAYDACEVAQILFLRRYGAAMMSRGSSAARVLALIERVAALLPTHTRRSEAGQALQQFSTPAGLAYVATIAASLQAGETLLEPSAGTGMLAIHAELAGANLLLNEIGAGRAALLGRLFPDCPVTRHDAAAIDDRLHPSLRPSVVLMNPPFSALANVSGTMKDAAMRHVRSALARLEPGGRLVAITGAGCAPDAPVWRDAFIAVQSMARVTFTAAIHGRVYARHGTTVETRISAARHGASARTWHPLRRLRPGDGGWRRHRDNIVAAPDHRISADDRGHVRRSSCRHRFPR